MSLPAFCKHVLTVITPGVKTVHGDDVDDWKPSAVTTRTISGCWVEPKSTEENNYRRDTTRAGFDILLPSPLPAGAVLPTSRDRIQHPLGEGFYQVQGEVMPVPSSNGRLDHYFLYVERWKVTNNNG